MRASLFSLLLTGGAGFWSAAIDNVSGATYTIAIQMCGSHVDATCSGLRRAGRPDYHRRTL